MGRIKKHFVLYLVVYSAFVTMGLKLSADSFLKTPSIVEAICFIVMLSCMGLTLFAANGMDNRRNATTRLVNILSDNVVKVQQELTRITLTEESEVPRYDA